MEKDVKVYERIMESYSRKGDRIDELRKTLGVALNVLDSTQGWLYYCNEYNNRMQSGLKKILEKPGV
ncbi:hypothetical protein HQ584_01715 [Patescibacteria group bacterium]|nr:hypothetical protein [Patescibacteria group bacterium]